MAAWFGFALRYDMWGRAVRLKSVCTRGTAPAGRVDGRAATACSCGAESPSPVIVVARFWVSSFSRGRATPSYSRSACVRKVVCVYEQTDMVITTTTTWSPQAQAAARAQLAPPSSQCAGCAFPSCSRDFPRSRSARTPPQPSRSTSRTVVPLDRGSRVLVF